MTIDYTTLKHDEKGYPTWDGFLGPVLATALEQKIWSRGDLLSKTIQGINFPKEMLEARYEGKWNDPILINRASWALSDLAISGILDRPARGKYKVSKLGRKIYQEYGLNITRLLIHSQPKYVSHNQQKKKIETQSHSTNVSVETKVTIDQVKIDDWFADKADMIKDQLIQNMVHMIPYKFESLMVKLLSVMGYKGDDGQSVVTQKSNDGGIDGIINQDPLGLQKVYVQVKRYAIDNSVGRPEIAGFSGAIKLKHADRGVFITTSSFTSGAIEAAKDLNITLVNGEMLTNLMLQYGVGVEVEKQYTIYRIDKDIFN